MKKELGTESLQIIEKVCVKNGVTIEQLKSKSRKSYISEARIECFVRLINELEFTREEVGDIFNRHNSNVTVLYHKYKHKYTDVKKDTKTNKNNLLTLLLEEENNLKNKLYNIRELIKVYEL